MDYKEKYEMALERAKQLSKELTVDDIVEQIFPELKESEGEKIRKDIVTYLLQSSNSATLKVNAQKFNKWIAWLEKQEQKQDPCKLCELCEYPKLNCHNFPCITKRAFEQGKSVLEAIKEQRTDNANKIAPKFKVGDWTVSNLDGKATRISEVRFDEYNSYYVVNGKSVNLEEYDRLHHLWTIQDANPGDVIYLPNGNNEYYLFIFKGIENAAVMSFTHFYQYDDGTSEVKGTTDKLSSVNDVFQPATKEQRDQLEKAIADAGYKWNEEERKLEKIEQKPLQWNISDYRTWQYIVCDVLTKHDGIGQYLDDGLCKKIAQYMQEEWSKKLCSVQHPTGWSEEDEKMFIGLTAIVDDWYNSQSQEEKEYYEDCGYFNWFKSLKQRIVG